MKRFPVGCACSFLFVFSFILVANAADSAADDEVVSQSSDGAESLSRMGRIFESRGFDASQITLPGRSDAFPIKKLQGVNFTTMAKFDWFPEGPTYRAQEDRYYFSGNQALTSVDNSGKLRPILGKPGGGGTHFLPDGSVLIIGHVGLRRLYPDDRVEWLADGKQTGPGNDLTVGIHGEVFFSVPKSGIYRLTPGDDGKLEKVCDQGCNGLEVDLDGRYLYVVRRNLERYEIDPRQSTLGPAEVVYEFSKGKGGGDGCTFDAWGNLYSVHFRTGEIRVVDPAEGKLLAEMPVGVMPSSNLTFGGPHNTDLFVTAGSPKTSNCQVLRASFGVTGFCGHVGSVHYPVIKD